jgi:hypothetical protein
VRNLVSLCDFSGFASKKGFHHALLVSSRLAVILVVVIASVIRAALAQPSSSHDVSGDPKDPTSQTQPQELGGVGADFGGGGDVDLIFAQQEIHLESFGEFSIQDPRVILDGWVDAPGSIGCRNWIGATGLIEIAELIQIPWDMPGGAKAYFAFVRISGAHGRQVAIGFLGVSTNGHQFLPTNKLGLSEEDENEVFENVRDGNSRTGCAFSSHSSYKACAAHAENDHKSCQEKHKNDLDKPVLALPASMIACTASTSLLRLRSDGLWHVRLASQSRPSERSGVSTRSLIPPITMKNVTELWLHAASKRKVSPRAIRRTMGVASMNVTSDLGAFGVI